MCVAYTCYDIFRGNIACTSNLTIGDAQSMSESTNFFC